MQPFSHRNIPNTQAHKACSVSLYTITRLDSDLDRFRIRVLSGLVLFTRVISECILDLILNDYQVSKKDMSLFYEFIMTMRKSLKTMVSYASRIILSFTRFGEQHDM